MKTKSRKNYFKEYNKKRRKQKTLPLKGMIKTPVEKRFQEWKREMIQFNMNKYYQFYLIVMFCAWTILFLALIGIYSMFWGTGRVASIMSIWILLFLIIEIIAYVLNRNAWNKVKKLLIRKI
jgi:ABC-type transport system involved in cytochrome bd biosynthesis fused ATPase/permease subunit